MGGKPEGTRPFEITSHRLKDDIGM